MAKEVMRGMKSKTDEAGAKILGGQTVMNPWFMVGGTIVTTVETSSITRAHDFQVGDKIVLTKPLGTNMCVRLAD